jgi:peptidoglycan/xylan/chitin deacetylase (PgdA/CDA1 family)
VLVASRRIALFDRYRVPYSIDEEPETDVIRIRRAVSSGPELISVPGNARSSDNYVFDGALVHAALADRVAIDAAIATSRRTWTDETQIMDLAGVAVATVKTSADGSILLPFDLDAPLLALLEERYLGRADAIQNLAARGYYAARRFLPYRLQMGLRRRYRLVQERAAFPAWPTETSLHRLEALLLHLVESVAGEPLPWIGPWPKPYRWSLVLTHDVERASGYGNIDAVRAVEVAHDLRSAWYFVPERDYRVEEAMLDRLRSHGCEICLHGLRHDGRDLAAGTFAERVPAMRTYSERWGALGFRSPSTLRDPRALELLGMEHDSSWSDVARYEPQRGGTCSWLPYLLGDLVELPITLPQDHTLFELRRERDEQTWLDKAQFLREQGGMALVLTHPDYMLDDDRRAAYDRFLAANANDETAWHALPLEIAHWWRRRARSSLVRSEDTWSVVGAAAADAEVRLGRPPLPSASAFVEAVQSR